MRVKLQNFAKAAILAIAQQNCSTHDIPPCREAGGTGSAPHPIPARWRSFSHLQARNCEYS
ncbi:hypothetical protein FQ185_09725 [Pseudomonas sp. ANT_H12B]|nr:hypothetical protein FQ185_09725 [Pseudomonas sp. ANT_H12B]